MKMDVAVELETQTTEILNMFENNYEKEKGKTN